MNFLGRTLFAKEPFLRKEYPVAKIVYSANTILRKRRLLQRKWWRCMVKANEEKTLKELRFKKAMYFLHRFLQGFDSEPKQAIPARRGRAAPVPIRFAPK